MKNFDTNLSQTSGTTTSNNDHDVLSFLENHFDDGGNAFCCGSMMDCVDDGSYKARNYEKEKYLQLAHATGSDRLVHATHNMLQQQEEDEGNQTYNAMFTGLLAREFEGIMDAAIYNGLRFGWGYHDNPAETTTATEAAVADVATAAGDVDSVDDDRNDCDIIQRIDSSEKSQRSGGKMKKTSKMKLPLLSMFLGYGNTKKRIKQQAPRIKETHKRNNDRIQRADNQRKEERQKQKRNRRGLLKKRPN